MCLAILAPKGVSKNKQLIFDAIENAAFTNDDGMGYAFKRNSTKKVYVSKGYTEVSKIIESIKSKNLKEDDELIIHLRYGNKGDINADMCHPFVCSSDHKTVITNDGYVDDPVFVHNGTFTKYSKHGSIFSDTYFFAKDFAYNQYVLNFLKNDKDNFKELMRDHIGVSRLIFLFPNENTNAIMLGDFKEDEGLYFSNEGYKNRSYVNYGGNEYYRGYNSNSHTANKQNSNKVTDKVPEKGISVKANVNKSIDKLTISGITIPAGCESYVDPITNLVYKLYMGMWICVSSGEVRINPTGMNYMHLIATALYNDYNNSVSMFDKFIISQFDTDAESLYRFHSLSSNVSTLKSSIIVDHSELVKKFNIQPGLIYKHIYKDYIKLVENLPVSKNQLKKVTKALNYAPVERMVLSYSKKGSFYKEALRQFQYNLAVELGEDYDEIERNIQKYCIN